MKIIFQGAEATISKIKNTIIKDRQIKSYRFPELDKKIRESRTRKESKLLQRAFDNNVPVPKVIETEKTKLILQSIQGKKLAIALDKQKNKNIIAKDLGKIIAKIHDLDIIHGDLTTSNFILAKNKIYIIDFGLGFQSTRLEDKATDLHVLKEALEAKHYKFASTLWSAILQGYKSSKNAIDVLKVLNKVELRGRYKAQY